MKFLIKVWKAIAGVHLALSVLLACLIGAYFAMEDMRQQFISNVSNKR